MANRNKRSQNSGNSNMDNAERGNMSVREAGALGGQKTAETHGREFYSEIGAEGGRSRSGGNNSNNTE